MQIPQGDTWELLLWKQLQTNCVFLFKFSDMLKLALLHCFSFRAVTGLWLSFGPVKCEYMQRLLKCDRNHTHILCLSEALLQEATFRQRATCCAHSSAVRHLQAAKSGSWDFEVHLASANVRGKSTESSKKERAGEKLPLHLQHAHTQSKVGLFKRTFSANTHLFSGLDTPELLSALRSSEQRPARFRDLSASAEQETFWGHEGFLAELAEFVKLKFVF